MLITPKEEHAERDAIIVIELPNTCFFLFYELNHLHDAVILTSIPLIYTDAYFKHVNNREKDFKFAIYYRTLLS